MLPRVSTKSVKLLVSCKRSTMTYMIKAELLIQFSLSEKFHSKTAIKNYFIID